MQELVDKFGQKEPCFSIMSSQSYVLAHEKFGAQVKLRSMRYGQSVYYGQIICRAGSGIKSIKDLQGKSIAYTDELSTSGYLYPKQILDKNNIKHAKVVFAKKHDEVVRMVYEGKVDAGAAELLRVRQAEHGEMVALDPLEKLEPQAFELIAADAGGDRHVRQG